MLASTTTIITLVVTCLIFIFLFFFLNKKKNKTQVHKLFSVLCFLLIFWLIELVLQATLSTKLEIAPIYFDYFVYINACFLPVIFLLLSISFSNTKFKFTKKYLLLFIIPIISLLVLWTNDFHHLFYIHYDTNFSKTIYGPYFYFVHSPYTYLLFGITFINFLKFSIKNAGFFSKQSLLLALGSIISVLINILGTFGIIKMSIYVTPMSFAVGFILYALAIFRFDFLKVAPIALQRVVDRISDRIHNC